VLLGYRLDRFGGPRAGTDAPAAPEPAR